MPYVTTHDLLNGAINSVREVSPMDIDNYGELPPPRPLHPSITDTAGELARAYRVIDALLDLIGTQGTTLDTFTTDMRAPADVQRKGNQYDVRKGKMGS